MPATRALDSPASATYVVSGNEAVDKAQGDAIAHKHGRQTYHNAPAPSPATTTPAQLSDRKELPDLVARQDAASCAAPFEQNGDEDIDAGDAGFDDPTDDDLSKPQCDSNIGVDANDLQNAIDYLDSVGDNGYQYDNCCGGVDGSCLLVATNGTAFVGLCGSTECIGCAQLANYVQGIHDTCAGDAGVGGTQAINESDDLTVEISLNDTT